MKKENEIEPKTNVAGICEDYKKIVFDVDKAIAESEEIIKNSLDNTFTLIKQANQQILNHTLSANPEVEDKTLSCQEVKAVDTTARMPSLMEQQMLAATTSVQQAIEQARAQLHQGVVEKNNALNHFVQAQQQLQSQTGTSQAPPDNAEHSQ